MFLFFFVAQPIGNTKVTLGWAYSIKLLYEAPPDTHEKRWLEGEPPRLQTKDVEVVIPNNGLRHRYQDDLKGLCNLDSRFNTKLRIG